LINNRDGRIDHLTLDFIACAKRRYGLGEGFEMGSKSCENEIQLANCIYRWMEDEMLCFYKKIQISWSSNGKKMANSTAS
jgi:hypothetical protein